MFRRVFAVLMLIMVGLSGFGAMARTEEPEAWQVFLEEEYQRLLPDQAFRIRLLPLLVKKLHRDRPCGNQQHQ